MCCRQNNIAGVYSFASPRNKEATGPLERFNKLFEHPMYKPLLGLTKAESLRRVQMTHETYAEVRRKSLHRLSRYGCWMSLQRGDLGCWLHGAGCGGCERKYWPGKAREVHLRMVSWSVSDVAVHK